jgi:hypothetical protein
VAFPAGFFGIAIPVFNAVDDGDFRMLPAVPFGACAIAVAYLALGARTPNRRFGRMLLAVLLLVLTMSLWGWPMSRGGRFRVEVLVMGG